MIARHTIVADRIREITIYGGDSVYSLSQPLEIKRAPRTIIDAQFSVPWVVATALVQGKVTVDDFTEEALKRQDILNVAQKVTARLDTTMNRHGVGPGGVIINMEDGAEYTEEVEHCLGSVERPMTFEDCTKKFRECAAFAIKPLPADTVDKVITMIARLEELDDATEIVRLLG